MIYARLVQLTLFNLIKKTIKKILDNLFSLFPFIYWCFRRRNYYKNKSETECQRLMHNEVIKIIIDRNPENILEYGVGNASLLKKIHNNNNKIRCYGVDLSISQIQSAKRIFPEAELRVCSLKKIRYTDNYFDVVYGIGVLMYLKPYERAKCYSELYRVTRDLLIAVEYITKYFSNELMDKFNNAGDYRYNYDIEESLCNAGFKIIESRKIGVTWDPMINKLWEMPFGIIICKKY